MSDLKDKTAKGIGWGFADNMANIGLMAIVNIILARILSPEEFGIMAMTALFITLATSLVDSGFYGALTRKKEVNDTDFNTVFFLNLSLSVVLYAILFLIAPAISRFFDVPMLVPIIRILGLSLFITAFSIVQKVKLVRKIDFKTQTIISCFSSVISGGVSITMALCGYGVWSLVALQLIRLFVTTTLLWIFSKWRPSLQFSAKSFKEMFSFGGRLVIVAIISVIWNEIYSLIIGKIYNSAILGQYSRAEKFKSMVSSNVGIVMQRVSYPVLSTIQDEKERQVRVYRKVNKTTMLITFTCVFGLAAIAPSLVELLIGDKWLPSVPYLQILCASGIFIPLLYNSVNIINADGRSDITLWLEISKTIIAVGPVLLGIYTSIEWMLWGFVGSYLLSYLLHAFCVNKVIHYSVGRQILDILPSFLIAIIMMVIVWLVGLLSIPYWLLLPLQLLVGVLIILLIYEKLYKSEEYFEVKGAILGLFKR